ncbi:hypothetical protein CEW89_06320 [Celeribacter ethanolicus]|uniref:Uncharacterized protein n=1 Tax=Celeribacter ethanolicus TaxID=1758178 RepID=A0A291GAL2_9RHOB|nr:hypothetical protein [Celeribacter ethanolicus]ATG47215.1 hypothetical protein CEW89_06320 [Celeribacter ethanolicus]
MSFYFALKTQSKITTDDILSALTKSDVAALQTDAGTVFYHPGQSLRGVILYETNDGYDIGLNAFTPRIDAYLAREIASVIAKRTQAEVYAEDDELAIPAERIAEYGGEDWIAARENEAQLLMAQSGSQITDQYSTVFGYKRPFALPTSKALSAQDRLSEIDRLMLEGIALQQIDDVEDIYPAQIFTMTFKAPKRRLLDRLKGRPQQDAPPDRHFFTVTEETRTLTPAPMNFGELEVNLVDKSNQTRAITAENLYNHARSLGCREYGFGSFDLTLSGDDFEKIFAEARALSPLA